MTSQTQVPHFSSWFETLEDRPLHDLLISPETCAIFSADMINGFLRSGPLASRRLDSITTPIVALMQRSWDLGLRDIVLLQDTHDLENPEFASWPPHAIAGTEESSAIAEIAALRFAHRMTTIEKNSLNPAIGTIFDSWLAEHDYITTYFVVGNCTDLCVYQLAMHLRLRANAHNLTGIRVVVPESCVATFDTADHPGDEFHRIFLYHMSLNGIQIVRNLT